MKMQNLKFKTKKVIRNLHFAICILTFTFLLALPGCSPSLIVRPDGTIEAKNYAIVQTKDGKNTYIPKPWWSIGFLDSIIKLVGSLGGGVVEVVK